MSKEKPLINYGMPVFARSKHGYFGGYVSGFLERARLLLTGANIYEPIWHLPGGEAHKYNGAGKMPIKGYGPNDLRIDINPHVEPDILLDVNTLHEAAHVKLNTVEINGKSYPRPAAILIDRPYTKEYHYEYKKRYGMPECELPSLNYLTIQALRIVREFGMVGVVDFTSPNAKRIDAKNVIRFPVDTGDGMDIRIYTQYMRMRDWEEWSKV